MLFHAVHPKCRYKLDRQSIERVGGLEVAGVMVVVVAVESGGGDEWEEVEGTEVWEEVWMRDRRGRSRRWW